MTEKTNFSTLLKHYRQASGLSQEALAARAGLSARAISDLERGINRTPRYDTLELLVSALSLSASQGELLKAAAWPVTTGPVERSSGFSLSSLPLPPDRLIGREQERALALSLLRRSNAHLLTLTGPGGAGKTRLALQLAQDLAPDFSDGVLFVPLAAIRDARLVGDEIAQLIGLREGSYSSLSEQINIFLHKKHFLLVLDNVEQIPECGAFIASLLARCPHLYILITSRTPLHLRGEQELLLAPLLPDDAARLFCERVQAIQPARVCELSEVRAICEQLDYLPLALELAARQIKIFSLGELRKQLTHRLPLLRGGARDLPVRQQTMASSIAWSYELLTGEQQRWFRILSVFRGGWTLEEAGGVVCPGLPPEEIFEEAAFILADLVDACLVQAEILASGGTRFTILEIIREYAYQQLQMSGEEEKYRRRHATYFAGLAERAVAFFGPEQGVRRDELSTLVQELPNGRAALEWAEQKQEAELGLKLACFTRLWNVQGLFSEAIGWMERMLALDLRAREGGKPVAPLTLRIEMLYGLSRTLVRYGRIELGAETFAKQALDLALGIGDQNVISNTYLTLGMVFQAAGKLDEAEKAYTESYKAVRLAGQDGLKSRGLSGLAGLARSRGQLTQAAELLEETLSLARNMGMAWDVAIATTQLGHLASQEHNLPKAKARYREALTLFRTFASPTHSAECLAGLAATIGEEGYYRQAIQLSAAAAALYEQAQTQPQGSERRRLERVVITAKAALDEQTFKQEWKAGRTLTYNEAIEAALSDKYK